MYGLKFNEIDDDESMQSECEQETTTKSLKDENIDNQDHENTLNEASLSPLPKISTSITSLIVEQPKVIFKCYKQQKEIQ